MGNKGKHKNTSFKNNLDRDQDFDLDEYIREQSQGGTQLNTEKPVYEHEDSSQFKNAVLFFLVFVAAYLWYFDWSPTQAWNSTFGSNENTVAEVTGTAPNIDIPNPPSPPSSEEVTASSLDMTITEYLSALRDKGYLGDEISSFSARQLYDANIPISYLDELMEAGFLSDLSFVYITNYYQNQIPLTYLNNLEDAGIYDELSFVDVTEFYNKEIPIEYLITLNEAGYLEELSFVYITNFYEAGVTTEFLDQLKEQGLYDDLNFLDIVDLYKREISN